MWLWHFLVILVYFWYRPLNRSRGDRLKFTKTILKSWTNPLYRNILQRHVDKYFSKSNTRSQNEDVHCTKDNIRWMKQISEIMAYTYHKLVLNVGDLVYKFKRIVGKPNFSDRFKKIIKRYIKVGYNLDVIRQSACLVLAQSRFIAMVSSLIARRWVRPQTL